MSGPAQQKDVLQPNDRPSVRVAGVERSEPPVDRAGGSAAFRPHPRDLWSPRDATHLLWRTGFGAAPEEIQQAAEAGLDATLDRLLTPQPESAEFKETEALLRRTALDTRNIAHLKEWWLYRMLYSANPLVEKMTLFWHNHFATSNAKVRSVEHMSAQNDLLRRHAVGSFRDLLHGMAQDVAMLVWLDGNANRKRQPNENFAREVMELFSLGVGNYTERDIQEAARAFTGWHIRNDEFWFDRVQHDFSTKTVFGKSGNFDGSDVIDLCLEQPACPKFLAGKLLRFLVQPEPEPAIVEQFADRIRAHKFNMTPVLRELFSSRLFFSPDVRHALIKGPVDLVIGAQRTLHSRANLASTVRLLADLGQDVFEPPTVKGWEGGRLWISSTTMIQRTNFAAELTGGDRFGSIADPAAIFESRQELNPQSVVQDYGELLLARDLDPRVAGQLQEAFRQSRGSLDQRFRSLIYLVMSMPEYQLT